jgi:MFS family permease
VFYVAYVGVGVLLLVRQPRNTVAWLLVVIGLAFLTTTTPGLDVEGLNDGTADASTWLRAWVSSWGGTLSYMGFFALAVVFPSGRLPGGWAGRLAALVLIVTGVFVAVMAVAPTMTIAPDGTNELTLPNPFAVLPDAALWASLPSGSTSLTVVPIIVALVIATGSLLVRYRRSSGILRLQLRWLVASIASIVAGVLFGLVASTLLDDGASFLPWIPVVIAFPTLPIAVGVAVSRYRLFDLDRVISRTIAYTGVTIALFALFVVVNLGTQAVLAPFVGGDGIATAISTLVVAAAFNPLRLRAQRIVDRRFNRVRYDQERTLEAFVGGLREDLDMERLLGHIRSTVDDAMEPRTIAVWRRDDGTAA